MINFSGIFLLGWHTPGKSGGIFCKVFQISYQFSVLDFQYFGNLFLRAEQSDCIESFFVATSGFASIDWNASGMSSRPRKNISPTLENHSLFRVVPKEWYSWKIVQIIFSRARWHAGCISVYRGKATCGNKKGFNTIASFSSEIKN